MNKMMKLFAEKLLVPLHPTLSRRILDDAAERIITEESDVHEKTPHLDEIKDRISGLFQRHVPISPTILDQSHHPDQKLSSFFDINEEEKNLEVILLLRDPEVGVGTTIEHLADLLKDGIENESEYGVSIHEYSSDLLESILSEDPQVKIRILLVYPKKSRPKQDKIDCVKKTHPKGIIHRVVYVSLTDVIPGKVQKLAKNLLDGKYFPGTERMGDCSEAHFCSLIPTLITPKPSRCDVEFKTEPIYDRENLRFHRDKTVLSASPEDRKELHKDLQVPLHNEIRQWARNVLNKQVGFASSGGGASAYRSIALLQHLHKAGIPIDVFGGLSGGSLIGAYFAGKGMAGLDMVLERGEFIARMLPKLMFTSKPIECMIDEDLDYLQLGSTSMRYHAITTEMCKDVPPGSPPEARVATEGTLGQAARASSSLPIGFAPTTIGGRRFTDGQASTLVPTHVVIDHGADVVMACNCIPGPDQTNPFSNSWLGRFAYDKTILGRYIDMMTWIDFLLQNASRDEGRGANVFFQFKPQNIATFEMLRWADSYKILQAANCEGAAIEQAVEKMKNACKGIPLQPMPSCTQH